MSHTSIETYKSHCGHPWYTQTGRHIGRRGYGWYSTWAVRRVHVQFNRYNVYVHACNVYVYAAFP